ncbi:MAG: peptide deformylase [Dehalococcoidia bacterium]|nr:peptide deformylase [Dehalococcoidia bacterium]
MAVLKIRTNPDPVLRKKSVKVTSIDESVRRLIDNMIETLRESSGVGLAANQVGAPLRIVVIQIPEEELLVLVNPEIVETTGERTVVEGCLSIPGYQAEICRAETVKVKAKGRNGKLIRRKASDLLAQAIQHEVDHLNGVLYIDYLDDMSQLVKTDSGPD